MNYTLAIGDRLYSSWSLRSWLLFDHFDIPVKPQLVRLYDDAFHANLAEFAPARTVPALRTSDGEVVWDTAAIAGFLASQHPELPFWPATGAGVAHSIAAEMHAGFAALRQACPMNLRHRFDAFSPSDAVRADLDRIEHLWSAARATRSAEGPWLFGSFGIVDAFFAPVAARIAGYSLSVGDAAEAYVATHLADPSFRRWRAMGFAENRLLPHYELPSTTQPWPGPDPLEAQAIDSGTAANAACPYSNKPVDPTALARIGGQVIGFCNPFCRDKSVADPMAWPRLVALLKELGHEAA